MGRQLIAALAGLSVLLVGASLGATPHAPRDDAESAFAILSKNCFSCHGALKTGGLDLRSKESALNGGARGAAILPGNPGESLLIRAISGADAHLKMPPSRPLTSSDVSILKAWVKAGAHFHTVKPTDGGRPWPFTVVKRPPVPPVSGARNPIDAFVLAKLNARGIRPAAEADRRTLIRRAYFDLIALPPSRKEYQTHLTDRTDRWYERMVETLLESPRHGERWARHWLDLTRYAESEGFKADEMRPNAWRYRDYVIKSLNQDKPFDRFLQEQVAGDELFPNQPDALIATGFLRHWADESNARNLLQRRQEILNDVTDTVGSTVLGMTFACARCHDHKYDPIPQKDYYRLQAFFAGIRPRDDIPLLMGDKRAEYDRRLQSWQAKTASIRDEITKLEEPFYKKAYAEDFPKFPPEVQAAITMPASQRTSMQWFMFHKAQPYFRPSRQDIENGLKGAQKERWQELQNRLREFREDDPGPLPTALGVTELGSDAPPTHLLIAGIHDKPGEPVSPGFPIIAGALESGRLHISGRRSVLAQWLTNPRNPLTARVIVNRVWHYHFGRGIVEDPSDFGKQGGNPSHPELLDWLAAEFMNPSAQASPSRESWRSGVQNPWSLKHLHRLIMNSAAYRRSAAYSPESATADPDNRLLWRFRRHRLEGEVIRDSVLAVSGELNLKMGGPGVMAELPEGLTTRGYWKETEDTAERNRRSIYIFVKRNLRYPLFEAFDMPDTHEACSRRVSTTTATQSLMLLNSELILRTARAFAGRIRNEASDSAAQIRRAYETAFGRVPTNEESARAARFVKRQMGLRAGESDADRKSLADLCQVLLNSNEFLYVE